MSLNDEDPMPFGKHQGKPMEQVPASYLHYLWTNGMREEETHKSAGFRGDVARYIKENMSALESEDRDLIWKP